MDEPGICFPSHWRLCTKTKVRFKGIRNLDTSRKVFLQHGFNDKLQEPAEAWGWRGGQTRVPEELLLSKQWLRPKVSPQFPPAHLLISEELRLKSIVFSKPPAWHRQIHANSFHKRCDQFFSATRSSLHTQLKGEERARAGSSSARGRHQMDEGSGHEDDSAPSSRLAGIVGRIRRTNTSLVRNCASRHVTALPIM